MTVHASVLFFLICSVMWMYREQWCRRGWQTDGRTEDSVASDVGDSTFAVFLQGDFYIGGGDVAFLSALLPRPCPAVAFILLDDVQHLQWWRCQNNTMTFFWWLASLVRHYGWIWYLATIYIFIIIISLVILFIISLVKYSEICQHWC